MAEKPSGNEEHPMLLELRSTRVALARFQDEAHHGAVKLQRYSLDAANNHERSSRLQRDNELLRAELAVLRDTNAVHDPLTSQMHVQELTLSLRKLSEKLTLTEEALLEKTTLLVNAETDSIKARVAQDAAYELGATVRGREEAGKLREWHLELKISTLEEQLRLSDAVVEEYAALVRGMEGRAKSSSDSAVTNVLPQSKLDLQHMLEKLQKAHAEDIQELERTRSVLDVVNAKLKGLRKGEEALRTEYGKTRTQLERLNIDDGTAAKMVSRYMQFSQSSTNSLLSSLETLKLRHNSTVSTLISQNIALTTQLRSLEDQNEHLRSSLDDLGGEVMKEKYGRRREVGLRIRMGGREERIAEGLRRWLRKGDEALRRIDQAQHDSGPPNDGSFHAAYEALLVMSQDAHILLAQLEDGGADEETALSMSGIKARAMMARFGLEGLLDELRAETQERLFLATKGRNQQRAVVLHGDSVNWGNNHSRLRSASPPRVPPASKSKNDSSLPPTPTAESMTHTHETSSANSVLTCPEATDYPTEEACQEEPQISLPDRHPPSATAGTTKLHDVSLAGEKISQKQVDDKVPEELMRDIMNDADPTIHPLPSPEFPIEDDTQEQNDPPAYPLGFRHLEIEGTLDPSQDLSTSIYPSSPSSVSIINTISENGLLPIESHHHATFFVAPFKEAVRYSESEATFAEADADDTMNRLASLSTPSIQEHSTVVSQPLRSETTLNTPLISAPSSPDSQEAQITTAKAQAANLPPPILVLTTSESNAPSATATERLAHPIGSIASIPPPAPSPPLAPNPLLIEISRVYRRYDDIQRSFRDCHLALEGLKASIPPKSSSSAIPVEVLIAVVDRLDDYTEDARVELEIRISDEELLAKGYETLLGVSGALAPTLTLAQGTNQDEISTEIDLHEQIARFIDGSDPLVQRARESFTKKLDDVQHDIAALKKALYDFDDLSESDSETLNTGLVSPTPNLSNGGGWTSWIRGPPSRPTTPTPGSTPTFGNVMTAPKLRHSTSFGQKAGVFTSQLSQSPALEGEGSRRSSFFGSLVGLGQSDQPRSEYMLGHLGLRVPMPSFVSLAPMSPGTAPMSAGLSSASSILSPSFSSLSPAIGLGHPPMTGSRTRTLSTMYMLGLSGKNGGGSTGILSSSKLGLPTGRSSSAAQLVSSEESLFQHNGPSNSNDADDVE